MRRGLLLHAAGLLVVLLALIPLARWQEVFQADEGAALAQADLLRDGEGWRISNPSPALDPEMAALPLDNSDLFADGTWAPFAKHPAYAVLLAGSMVGAGGVGPILVSVLGTFVASVLAALIAERVRAGTGVLALWVTGIASPLFFDAYLVIAHAGGAALAAALAWFAVRAMDGRRVTAGAVVAVVALGIALQLLRTEGVLLAVALGAALAIQWLLARRTDLLVLAAATAAGGVLGYLLEPVLRSTVVGDPSGTFGIGTTGGGGGLLQDRIDAARVTLVETSFFSSSGRVALLLGAVLLVASAALARRSPLDRLVPVLAVAGAALVLLRLVSADDPVPGLLVAFPLLVVGLVALRRSDIGPSGEVLGTAAALFALAVLATQYAGGGGGGWGGRYFAIGIPLMTPLVAVGLRSMLDRLPEPAGRIVAASWGAVSVALAVVAIVSLHEGRTGTGELVDHVVAARGEDGAPVFTTAGALGRFAWQESMDGGWLSVTPDDLPALSERLASEADTAVFVTRAPEDDLPVVAGDWEVVDTEDRGNFTVVQLQSSQAAD